MGFYQWRFRISLRALESLPPALRLGGGAAANRGAERDAEPILISRSSWSSGFLDRIRSPRRRRAGPRSVSRVCRGGGDNGNHRRPPR